MQLSCVYQDQEEWHENQKGSLVGMNMKNHIRLKVSSSLVFVKQLGGQERENCLFCSEMLTCNVNIL